MSNGILAINHDEENTISKKKAIVIGVSEYISDLQTLSFCKKDGKDVFELLTSLGYEILKDHRLIGHVNFNQMRDAIFDFFNNDYTNADETLVFYFSGHGIATGDGDVCLASSEINPNDPYRRGFSSSELTRLMQNSVSLRVVTILDCCYSGAAKLSKGHEDDAAKIGTDALQRKARVLQAEQQGEGKCLLAASQAAQEAYGLQKQDHSIFTYYLLEGLRGNERSVDVNGNITAYSLGSYVYKAILNLPPRKRPKQKPITKVEASGDIILASYPNLSKSTFSNPTPISSGHLFYSLLPEQVLQGSEDLRQLPRPSTSTSYLSDEGNIKSRNEQYYSSVATSKRNTKQGLKWFGNLKLIVLVIAVVVSSVAAFIFIEGIQFQPRNNLPSAVNESVTTKMNMPVSVTLTGIDEDKHDTIIADIVTPPSHGTLGTINQVSGVVEYTPNKNFTGNDQFTFKVNDGISDSRNLGIVLISINQLPNRDHLPSAVNESVTTKMNMPVSVTLTGIDEDKHDTIIADIVTPPSHGTLGTINQVSGVVEYTPNKNFTGNDGFTYKVNDGNMDSNNTALVKIGVR
jgi:hypothetical protein